MEFAVTENPSTPASRQKNCNSCVQAKRRCDRRTPICSRCVEKKTACVYSKPKKPKMSRQPGKNAREPAPHAEAPSLQNPPYSPLNLPCLSSFAMNYSESMSTSFPPEVIVESAPQPNHDAASSSNISMDAFMQFIENGTLSSSDQWLIRADDDYLPERPLTPAGKEIMAGYSKMAACLHLDSWDAYDPKTPLYYILNRVKEFTAEMAAKNATPFIHRHLYYKYRPRCIMSCFTTCVLYASRTPTNMAMVIRAISDSAREFVDAEAHVVRTSIEKLARSQALFLYQIIRLFDGDITLRAQGEKDMGLLKTWLGELCRIRDNLGDLALLEYASVREQSPIEWEKWIFAESVRRTVIMAYAVIGIYELLKESGDMELNSPWDYVHRWTIGRSLWEADSSTEFRRAWKESSHFVIANFMLEDFVENGKGEDVDDFAEIFLEVYMGGDATEEFMARRKQER
ncbi:hypothetical protein F5Y12DRAFT_609193 [Xylaria sp. FL1777]|nr:hypothetical protein F5Y12DRAFT_609193 [Xylaria sp. FL1777]